LGFVHTCAVVEGKIEMEKSSVAVVGAGKDLTPEPNRATH
jgi:hypothetical protein